MSSPRSPHNNLSSELRNIITNKTALSMRSRMKVLNALNEDNLKDIAEREKRLRLQAIQELLTTEVTYLQHLEILMEFFLQPIIEKKLLNHVLLNASFENIKTLYNISGELVKELKQDIENIAGAFHKLAPFFKLYSVYAYDFEQISSLLQVAQEKDPTFKMFINRQETRPEVGRLLSSLLITPIQRVPRYKLLLKEVLRHTSVKHKEYVLLQACLVEIEKAAVHINNLVAQNEGTQRLLTLQKSIVNGVNLVKPGRRLIKQGTLMKVSRNRDNAYRRYFVLLNDTLLYCKGKPESSLIVRCVLPLNKCKVESILSGGLFRIVCLEETLLLYSEDGDSNGWLQSMQKAIEKYTECRQTLRKDSSSRKPLRHNNINLFPSEGVQQRYVKRKRTEDKKDVQLNPSSVMYFEKEDQDHEVGDEEDNCFRLYRKLKKLKNETSTETCADKDTSLCNTNSSNTSLSRLTTSDSMHYVSLTLKNIYNEELKQTKKRKVVNCMHQVGDVMETRSLARKKRNIRFFIHVQLLRSIIAVFTALSDINMAVGSTKVVQVTNIAPQATKDQMQTLFGYLGKIEDIRLYPTIRDVAVPVQSRICYVKFHDQGCVAVAQHMTNTVFIDRALIVIPYQNGDIPDEQRALELTNNGTVVPGLYPSEPKLPPNVVNAIEGIPPNHVITTMDPKLEAHGLPPYPHLPGHLDSRRIEEIRRTLVIANLDASTTAEQLLEFFSNNNVEIKYLRLCTRDSDTDHYALVELTEQGAVVSALLLNGKTLGDRNIKIYHSTQAIAKPEAKSNEAAQKEIEEAMSRVKEAHNLISAAIDPMIDTMEG
ncbi:hypothetical protein KPH14_007148 [Odynerus spinipes]|uniref:Uncharacterized protein n=1 Tax=Odynerus spinipes TaxID=1348599 RepID=A0AAD9VS27_9HYME|nr:hypothetical protein KPH14_007148 [Odynerus spinipes]